jgi:hypothetical protein
VAGGEFGHASLMVREPGLRGGVVFGGCHWERF